MRLSQLQSRYFSNSQDSQFKIAVIVKVTSKIITVFDSKPEAKKWCRDKKIPLQEVTFWRIRP